MHKSVVHISGNNSAQPKDKQYHRTTIPAANRRYVVPQNVNSINSHNRLTVATDRQYEKAHSLDNECDKFAVSVRSNFDKSHSLDESYGGELAKPKKYMEHGNYSQTSKHSSSPQKYGNRLYLEPEIVYERSRQSMLYSPLMYKRDHSAQHVRGATSREHPSNLGGEPIYRTMAKSYDHLQSAVAAHQYAAAGGVYSVSPTKRTAKLAATNASPSSDYELNASDFNVDYDLRRNVNNERLGFYGGQNPDTTTSFSNQRRRDTKKVASKPTTVATTLSPSAATSSRYLRK